MVVKLRSLSLALVGAGLLASAAVLGAILVHDEAEPVRLGSAQTGDVVEVKGTPEPFYPTGSLADWGLVLPLLGNHTYTLQTADGIVALLSADSPVPAGVVLAEGTVAFVGPHPDAEALLVVIQVRQWREPILFR